MSSPPAPKSIHVLDVDYKYLDSGPPPSANYTTWVFVHGMGSNAAVFEKLLPLAHAHNLRIVSLYRRGYPPSSGFRDAELAGIGIGKKFEEAEPFFHAQGTEIATFLVKLATAEHIPEAGPKDSDGGGIVLIGWSLGVIHVMALLAYLDTLPEDTQSTLQKYLRTVLPHDPAALTFGMPGAPGHDIRHWTSLDSRTRYDAYFGQVSAHFAHRSITSENPDDLNYHKPNLDIPGSFHALSYAECAKYTHFDIFLDDRDSCDIKLSLCDIGVLTALTRRALFDKARAAKSPRVKVRCMGGGTSSGLIIWALWTMRKHMENPETLYGKGAEKARDIKVMIHTEGNHFIFWEDPEKAIQQYFAAINQ